RLLVFRRPLSSRSGVSRSRRLGGVGVYTSLRCELELGKHRAHRGATLLFPVRRTTMAKVGRFVTDPKAGSFCQITLESDEKILVSHDRGGFGGGSIVVQEVRWWGFVPGETIIRCDLE